MDKDSIDVVIPWVDDADPGWKALRDKYLGEFHEKKSNLDHYFRDWDTLRYLFRSIEKNMPWVRKVHLVTCGQVPEWLDTAAPKLSFAKHADFFAKGTELPTFSSRPIEMNLMNIPDLSEKFVYFNDDCLVTQPVSPDRFFKAEMPVDYFALDIPRGGWLYDRIRIKDPYAQTVKNAINLLNKVYPIKKLIKNHPELFYDASYTGDMKKRTRLMHFFGVYKWIKVNHNPQPYLLSNLRACEQMFPEQIKETRKHRFREYTDLNQYFFRDYALMSGRFYPHYFNDDFCMVLSSVEHYRQQRHYLTEKAFICLNDTAFLSREEYPLLREMVINDMNALFPKKSSFEK